MSESDEVFAREGWRVVRLDEARDAPAVTTLSMACADYAMLVNGEPPKPTDGPEFFRDAPPGHPLDAALKLGLRRDGSDALLGVLDVARGYPEPHTWYVGLLLLRPDARGRGAGRAMVEGLAELARSEGAMRLMLGVLEENVGALRFWRSIGFSEVRRLPPRRFGAREHALIEFARTLA